MQIIPNIPAIKDDELLISFFHRLANANGKAFGDDCYTDYFTNTWHGMGPTLENLAEQMCIDVIDLFLDHTTFAYEQLFMTRKQHKAIIADIFDPAERFYHHPAGYLHNDFKYVKICKDCAEESDTFYIRRNHQLPMGWCTKHSKRLKDVFTSNIFQAGTSLIKIERIPHPESMPTEIDLQSIEIAETIMRERLTLNLEEIMPVVLKEYQPSSFLNTHWVDEIERFEPQFFGSQIDEQISYLSDVYCLYREFALSGDYQIQDYPNLTLGLIADTFKNSAYLKQILPVNQNTYSEIVQRSARRGYRVLSTEVKPMMRIMDTANSLKRIVSVYSILDEEL